MRWWGAALPQLRHRLRQTTTRARSTCRSTCCTRRRRPPSSLGRTASAPSVTCAGARANALESARGH
eukprot:4050437-Prymnesium_polylepis.1